MLLYRYIKLSVLTLIILMSMQVHAITVSPARVEVSGNKGQVLRGEIDLYNEQSEDKTFYVSYENFESGDETGAPKFIGGKDGLAQWIQTDSSVAIQKGQKKTVPFTITIPADAESGGYFSTVFFGDKPVGDKGDQVTIGSKIGVLILLRVNGPIREGAGLVGFSTEDNARFYANIPVSFVYKVNNTGADRIVPVGDIKIKNTIRVTTDTILLNEGRGSVLPNSTRKFSPVWKAKNDEVPAPGFFNQVVYQIKHFHLGWYTAEMHISWGEGTDKAVVSAYNFFVFPWQLLLVILCILIILKVFGGIILKKYKANILAQAKMMRSHE